ncbi:Crp/Fnr family transcriptional regulator [Bradyrhizobium sp. UFLA05-109]
MLRTLDAADFALLEPHLATVKLVREMLLGVDGARPKQVYFPLRGAVSMTVNLAERQTIEVAMLGRDSVIGSGAALAGSAALADAFVLFPGTAVSLDCTAFCAIANQSSRFRRLMVRHEQAPLAHAQQSVLCNTLHPAEARLARWLLRARDLCDSATVPLTQELLAQMIGVRRNAISLVAHSLQRAGIIRYSRGQIEITDSHALEATCCACYGAVKHVYGRLLVSAP